MATKAELLQAIRANPFVLAPMAGITDHAFRKFMKGLDASVVISELISATGIAYKSERTIHLTRFDESQRPVGIQLFGEDPQQMASAAKFIEDLGADFVDVNFGCPVPKVVKKGAGSAALKDLPAMATLLRGMVKAVSIPVTIKIRTGWDAHSRNAGEVARLAHDEGITWVAIHGRTRAQAYNGLSDWDYIREVKAGAPLPILGNGDILFADQAVKRLQDSGCDGVLIGRGALKNPYIFREALGLWKGQRSVKSGVKDYGALFTSLHDCFAAHCEERILQIQLKKFAAWFATGYPGAAQFRKNIFRTQNSQEVATAAHEYFATLQGHVQADTSSEAFLMGGHG